MEYDAGPDMEFKIDRCIKNNMLDCGSSRYNDRFIEFNYNRFMPIYAQEQAIGTYYLTFGFWFKDLDNPDSEGHAAHEQLVLREIKEHKTNSKDPTYRRVYEFDDFSKLK